MKSMTGFGRAEAAEAPWRCVVELSSVNRKQADVEIRMPREWQALEAGVRGRLTPAFSRGRLHAVISVENAAGGTAALEVDEGLAAQYAEALTRLSHRLGGDFTLTPEILLRAPGVFTVREATAGQAEAVLAALTPALDQALQAWDEARRREGLHLEADLTSRVHTVQTLLDKISDLAPSVAAAHRENLRRRLEEAGLPLPLEDERLLKEIALFADKSDISEEISRLGGHLAEFVRMIHSGEPSGRAMDFLTQEMHRELNTMGAKAAHSGIAHLVVAGKTEVERIREQVQNVE